MNNLPTTCSLHAVTRLPVLAAVAVMVTGCASMAPSYDTPSLPVSSTFAADVVQQGASVAAIGWREYFTDPQLQTVIKLALDNNRDLRVAVLNIEAARAVLGQRRADLWPTLNAGASAVRGTGSTNGPSRTGSQTRLLCKGCHCPSSR